MAQRRSKACCSCLWYTRHARKRRKQMVPQYRGLLLGYLLRVEADPSKKRRRRLLLPQGETPPKRRRPAYQTAPEQVRSAPLRREQKTQPLVFGAELGNIAQRQCGDKNEGPQPAHLVSSTTNRREWPWSQEYRETNLQTCSSRIKLEW